MHLSPHLLATSSGSDSLNSHPSPKQQTIIHFSIFYFIFNKEMKSTIMLPKHIVSMHEMQYCFSLEEADLMYCPVLPYNSIYLYRTACSSC